MAKRHTDKTNLIENKDDIFLNNYFLIEYIVSKILLKIIVKEMLLITDK